MPSSQSLQSGTRIIEALTMYRQRAGNIVGAGNKLHSLLKNLSHSVVCRENRNAIKTTGSPNSTVFANHYLNFDDVKVVGFDLDYTLLTYTSELQDLIYNLARNSLITSYGFPGAFRECKFDPNFAVRGLSVDVENGTLCKWSDLQKVGLNHVYKGKRPLSAEVSSNSTFITIIVP